MDDAAVRGGESCSQHLAFLSVSRALLSFITSMGMPKLPDGHSHQVSYEKGGYTTDSVLIAV